jgi:hypothetical protein
MPLVSYDVDARDKRGHDGARGNSFQPNSGPATANVRAGSSKLSLRR